jgi:riboflavin kinase
VRSLKGDLRSWRLLFTLFKLAELGAVSRTVRASTEYLAEKIGMSQQTASRNLIKLETMGWIKRNVTPEGCLITITSAGTAELKKLYSDLRSIFEKEYPPYVTLEGILFTGIGEGAYYVTQEKYRKQFMEKMGFDPYPGTLNLKLTTEYDMKTRTELESYPAIELEGFSDGSRTFGPVKCYPVMINNRVKGALVFAIRSHYNASVLEIVAPIYLRSHLKLKDGHKVKVEVITLP